MIRPASLEDATAITAIYNHYIEHSIATFEEEPISEADMTARLKKGQAAGLPWSVVDVEGATVGYGYVGPWHTRCAFRFAGELTVYLQREAQGKGWGSAMYERLRDQAREHGFKTLVGGISLPNEASVKLHEKLGMKKVAHFEKVGFKFGEWIDVGYWQGFV